MWDCNKYGFWGFVYSISAWTGHPVSFFLKRARMKKTRLKSNITLNKAFFQKVYCLKLFAGMLEKEETTTFSANYFKKQEKLISLV